MAGADADDSRVLTPPLPTPAPCPRALRSLRRQSRLSSSSRRPPRLSAKNSRCLPPLAPRPSPLPPWPVSFRSFAHLFSLPRPISSPPFLSTTSIAMCLIPQLGRPSVLLSACMQVPKLSSDGRSAEEVEAVDGGEEAADEDAASARSPAEEDPMEGFRVPLNPRTMHEKVCFVRAVRIAGVRAEGRER